VKRAVYQRDQGRCQYIAPLTGRKCGSSHAIQYDHSIVPFALGGQSTVENLQITCSMHNRIRAVEIYGRKMSAYIKM
jgi:5-methylcytosine-specific restriction endonuclease McrA